MTADALSAEELDFVRWMDELDLEEVNLLDGEPEPGDDFGAQRERTERLDGSRDAPLPPASNDGLGWDTD